MTAASAIRSRIPLCIPDLGPSEADAVSKAVMENWVSSAGPEVSALELEMARITGRAFAVATVNGTAALHMAVWSCGISAGDEVIVPDWTFAATANAVAHAGAKPFFVDVGWLDWALDASLVDEALAKNRRIKAVVAVDPLGHSADFDELGSVCAKHNVTLVEDAAAAIGSAYKGRPCGSFGRVSTFSFNGNKTITAGGGGILATDDDGLAERVRHVSSTARVGRDYRHDVIGWNYRMPNLNAALALAQVKRLDEIIANKTRIASAYDAALGGRLDLVAMPRPQHCQSTNWLYNVRTSTEEDANSLVESLGRVNIEARIFWRSLSKQAAWSGSGSLLTGVSQALTGTVVSLPSSAGLKAIEQDRVIDAVMKWRGRDISG